MAAPYEVLKMTDTQRYNDRNERIDYVWVTFKVGDLGPFSLEIPRTDNFGQDMRNAIMKFVANVNAVKA